MQFIKTFQYRLLPTDEQNEILHRHAGNVRFVWNKLLEFANDKTQLTDINRGTLSKQVVDLKNSNEFLKSTYSQPLQVQADRLYQTFKKSRSKEIIARRKTKISIVSKIEDPKLREIKMRKAERFGFPHFKSKFRHEDSIFYPQNFKIGKYEIYLPKIGNLKFIRHIPLEGTPKNVTIKQDGKFWNCSICCEVEIPDVALVPLEQANIVGIDMGIKTFASLSDGSVVENPKFLQKFEKRIKIHQKRLSKKELNVKIENGKEIKISSNNRNKEVCKLQKEYRKLRNNRKNFLHQETHRMITKYDGFCVETLDIRNMIRDAMKKHKICLIRSIYDVSWYEFIRLLEYKSLWNSKYFIKMDKFYPSTQTCPFCGHVDKEITLDDRILLCPKCKVLMERDLRASQTILHEGMIKLRDNYNIPQEPWEFKTVGESVENAFDESVTSFSECQSFAKTLVFAKD